MTPTLAAGIAPIQTEIYREPGLSVGISPPKDASFSNVLEGMVASANERSKFADGMSEAFAAGARDDIHGTMIAMSKADIELHLVGTVRNKVIDAFYELWRMQI